VRRYLLDSGIVSDWIDRRNSVNQRHSSLVYPLSIGPYVWFMGQTVGAIHEPDFTFYEPLFWFAERSPVIMQVLYWYLEFFSP
jgi:hypothetical protein